MATAMAAQQKLSHQLSGEPNLEHRLAANTKTQLDQAGENVAFAPSVDQAQDSLMHSPPHRANLLNAGYNVAGFSVVRSGSLLYVTQDFGHSLTSLFGRRSGSPHRPERGSHAGPELAFRACSAWTAKKPASTACAMAEADSLRTPAPSAREVLRYTTSAATNHSREFIPRHSESLGSLLRGRLLLCPHPLLSHRDVLGRNTVLLDLCLARLLVEGTTSVVPMNLVAPASCRLSRGHLALGGERDAHRTAAGTAALH